MFAGSLGILLLESFLSRLTGVIWSAFIWWFFMQIISSVRGLSGASRGGWTILSLTFCCFVFNLDAHRLSNLCVWSLSVLFWECRFLDLCTDSCSWNLFLSVTGASEKWEHEQQNANNHFVEGVSCLITVGVFRFLSLCVNLSFLRWNAAEETLEMMFVRWASRVLEFVSQIYTAVFHIHALRLIYASEIWQTRVPFSWLDSVILSVFHSA